MGTAGLEVRNAKRKLFLDANLYTIFAVTLMSVMGVSSIASALPKIAEEMGIAKGNIGILISAFTIPGVLLTPVMGALSDRLGRKAILVPSLFLFGLAGKEPVPLRMT